MAHAKRLYKREKLCSLTSIDLLFDRNNGETEAATSYPIRCVWRLNTNRTGGAPVQFLISVPKKKLRHAVDRVATRRHIREAYRLNRDLLPQLPKDTYLDVAFIYLTNSVAPSTVIHAAMRKALDKIALSTPCEPSSQTCS